MGHRCWRINALIILRPDPRYPPSFAINLYNPHTLTKLLALSHRLASSHHLVPSDHLPLSQQLAFKFQQCCGSNRYLPQLRFYHFSMTSLVELLFGPIPRVDINSILPSYCSAGNVRESFEQELFPGADTLKQSSSTETESGYQHQQVPLSHRLSPGQQESSGEGAAAGMRWTQTWVPRDYLANVHPPRFIHGLFEMIKTRTLVEPTTIEVPWTGLSEEESARLQKIFPTLWHSIFLVIIAFLVKSLITVMLLRGRWRWARKCHKRQHQYIA